MLHGVETRTSAPVQIGEGVSQCSCNAVIRTGTAGMPSGFCSRLHLQAQKGSGWLSLHAARGEDFQSLATPGLYPAGEGAGYAGGIVSAAVDGLKVGGAVAAQLLGHSTCRDVED